MRRAKQTDYGWHWRGRVRRPWLRGGFLNRKGVGRWGEWLALRHLRRLRWDVLARNWTVTWGELDLIAYHGETLVVLEVKTLLSPAGDARPEDHLDRSKLGKMERLGFDFLRRKDLTSIPMRLDLIAIETPDLRNFDLRHYLL